MTEDFEEWEYIVNQSHAMPDFMTARTACAGKARSSEQHGESKWTVRV